MSCVKGFSSNKVANVDEDLFQLLTILFYGCQASSNQNSTYIHTYVCISIYGFKWKLFSISIIFSIQILTHFETVISIEIKIKIILVAPAHS